MENRLGPRLLNRSTRSLSLTEAGELLYRRYAGIHATIERAEQEVSDIRKTHSGTVRIAAPFVSTYVGVPLVSDLHRKFPEIDIRLSVVNPDFDLIQSGCDAAIHVGDLKISNLICRKAATVRLAVCATTGYLDANGRPAVPKDLQQHNCLRLGSHPDKDSDWFFREARGHEFRINVAGNFSVDNEIVLLRACLAGIGVCQLPTILLEQHIDSGSLEVILDEFSHIHDDVYIVLPHREITEKVRLVVDFLGQQISARFAS